jgi:hypothetical protein
MAKSLRRSDFPHRCSNCRTPDWRLAPVYPERDEAYHYRHGYHPAPYAECKICHPARPDSQKWRDKAAKNVARKKRRQALKLAELAEKLGKLIVDSNVATPYVTLPIPRPGHVIPPPPGLEDGEG